MTGKIRFQLIHLYFFLILLVTGFTSCLHKHKSSNNSNIIREMPLPDVNATSYSPEVHHKEVLNDEKIYSVVEQMPQFPGGESELLNYISKQLNYPGIARRNGIQGKVICRFIITRTGRIEKPEVVRSLDPACDKEALRVLRSMPVFIPGKQNGVNVDVYYTLPVIFRLE